MSSDLDFALELARQADAITMARFRALDLKIETKPDRTPVTEADKATERARYDQLLRQGLRLLADELPPIDTRF